MKNIRALCKWASECQRSRDIIVVFDSGYAFVLLILALLTETRITADSQGKAKERLTVCSADATKRGYSILNTTVSTLALPLSTSTPGWTLHGYRVFLVYLQHVGRQLTFDFNLAIATFRLGNVVVDAEVFDAVVSERTHLLGPYSRWSRFFGLLG